MDASRSKQCVIIRFLVPEGQCNADIYQRMVRVYGDYCLGCTAVNKWCKSFHEGGKQHQICQDRAKQIKESAMIPLLPLIQANQKVMTCEISHKLNLSKGTVHTIIHKHLGYSKVHAAWVPKHLTLDHQKRRMGFCLQQLIRYEENPAFLDCIAAGDETWYHYYTPESKKTNMQWKYSLSPPRQKLKATITARKVMLSFIFDCHGPLLIEFLTQGSTINSAQYYTILVKLGKAIKTNCQAFSHKE